MEIPRSRRTLLDVNRNKFEIIPSLAKERPKVSMVDDGEFEGGMKVEYEIRKPKRVVDNGTPVTAYDVIFTYKTVKNPLVDAEAVRSYIDFVDEVLVDKENPKKFTVYCKKKYFDLEYTTGGQVYIMPEYAYDPSQVMRKFSFKDLNDDKTRENCSSNGRDECLFGEGIWQREAPARAWRSGGLRRT